MKEEQLTTQLYTCPLCCGQGFVSKPPWVDGDALSWPSSTTGSHVCPVCHGQKVIASSELPTSTQEAELDVWKVIAVECAKRAIVAEIERDEARVIAMRMSRTPVGDFDALKTRAEAAEKEREQALTAQSRVEAVACRWEGKWQAAEAEVQRLQAEILRAVAVADRGVPTRSIEIIRAALAKETPDAH